MHFLGHTWILRLKFHETIRTVSVSYWILRKLHAFYLDGRIGCLEDGPPVSKFIVRITPFYKPCSWPFGRGTTQPDL